MKFLKRGYVVETLQETFTDQVSKTVSLSGHKNIPTVTVMPQSSVESNMSFFTSAITASSVTVECTANYTGTVNIHAISTL